MDYSFGAQPTTRGKVTLPQKITTRQCGRITKVASWSLWELQEKKPYLLILSYILWPLQFNEEVLQLLVKPAGHPVPKQERHFDTLWNNCREQKEDSFYVIICNKTIPAMAELPAAQRDCNSEGNTYRTFVEEVIVRSHRWYQTGLGCASMMTSHY